MRFEIGWVTVLTTASANAQICAIRAPVTECCFLREFGITPTGNTTASIGLARATTVSATPTGNIAGLNCMPGVSPAALAPASGTVIVTGWTTPPVIAATYLRRASMAATIGAGLIWTWPADRPLIVGNGGAIMEIVLCNLNAATFPTLNCWACWES